ncbi:hypothetical protein LSTR_LSTR008156 [Laodelphax striatellus]|uniref:Uncharacterized protein n=1 Tax=Laodelphax striatellus TaxID=195883 RepID=A0A482WZU0_LAOST|nr:hypothetical protein LSTR_LSTR008156 [Laodelphax striatellus]
MLKISNGLSILLIASIFQLLCSSLSTAENNGTGKELERALKWLITQRGKDWGWGSQETTQALLAVSLTRTGDPLERELSTKQMELNLVLQLWRHHETPPLTPGKIAMYALALTANCHDPRQFHGHDLIGSLLHHEAESDSEFALASLAICSSGAHVRKRHLRRLLDIASSKHSVDSLGGVVLALQCIVKDHRNRNLQQYLRKPILALASLQQSSGGFGSLHSTALAIQALGDETEAWNRSTAVSWLVNQQGPDGAFFDIDTTSEVILALASRGLGNIKEVDCDDPLSNAEYPNAAIITFHTLSDTTTEPDTKPSSKPNKAKSVANNDKQNKTVSSETATTTDEGDHDGTSTVSYTLWVGSNVTENHTISITMPHNSTFYNVMQMAAEKDNHYVFSATEWPNGHYVHTLAGFKEQPMKYRYWLLYRLPSLPDPSNPPGNQLVAPTGVDDLIVEDGEHYLFWYKKL